MALFGMLVSKLACLHDGAVASLALFASHRFPVSA
jgi:hypothetical protein